MTINGFALAIFLATTILLVPLFRRLYLAQEDELFCLSDSLLKRSDSLRLQPLRWLASLLTIALITILVLRKILKDKCISDFFLRGDLGWAESYVDGNWETSNLTDFLEWGARNFHEFSKYVRGKWFTILYLRLKHHLKKNSRTGSKKNISFHYDLGNSFYEKWLDESMTYSSAMFKDPKDNLHKGQINKYENLANITGVKECD